MVFPTLQTWLDQIPEFDYSKLYIVAEQHLLSTTGSLIDKLIEIGVHPEHIYMTGKIYSTNDGVAKQLAEKGIKIIEHTYPKIMGHYSEYLIQDIQKMWREAMKEIPDDAYIVVLDDGGYTLKNVPESIIHSPKIIGIEQTTSGTRFRNSIEIPVINVAGSAAKMVLESPLISKALVEKINTILETQKPESIGVLGCGNIGKAIIFHFSKIFPTYFYDIDPDKMETINHLGTALHSSDELFQKSDIIIGATGKDVSDAKWLDLAEKNKILISVSSGDVEFKSLLQSFTSEVESIVDDIILPTKNGHSIKVLRGGTVANFDNSPSSVSTEEIQLTRGLLYAAFIQAIDYFKSTIPSNKFHKLNANYQKEVVKKWLKNYPDAKNLYFADVLDSFSDERWVDNQSN